MTVEISRGTLLAGRYELLRRVGQGGMAEVYEARDRKHDRSVAVKLLLPDVAADIGTERFAREIALVAHLSHPHILPLFDSGEHEGRLYFVMPFVETETLRDLLARSGPLPADEAIQLAVEVADALGYAHARGVVHRDVKPENILLSNGHAIVTDFGIARADAAGASTTRTGFALGTPGYMSPEQAAGEHTLDGRSDIYALACVLYEMLAGMPPFSGATLQAIIVQHLTAPAPSVRDVFPSLPHALDAALARGLAKHPDDRFRTMAEFGRAIRQEVSDPRFVAAPRQRTLSLAVLPLSNLSAEPDAEYFSDGLTEEIIDALSQVRALRVTSRTTSLRLKGTTKTVSELRRELGVRYLLAGSVRRAGRAVRITAQLIDAESDTPVWSDRFDGQLDDVFELQAAIARRIVGALEARLTPEEELDLAARRVTNIRAYDYYLRAKREFWALSPESLARAMGLLERAIELAGENDVLYAAMGMLLTYAVDQGVTTDPAALERAEAYAERALAVNPSSAAALCVRGAVSFKSGRIEDAIRFLRRGLAADPNNADALNFQVQALVCVGGIDEARLLAHRLIALDPLTPVNHALPGFVEWFAGDLRLALAGYRTWYEMDPRNHFAAVCLAYVYTRIGEPEAALRTLAPITEAPSAGLWSDFAAFFAAVARRDLESARRSLSREMVVFAESEPVYAHWLAMAFAVLAAREETLAWLGRAIVRGFCHAEYCRRLDPAYVFLRADAAFEDAMARMDARRAAVEAAARSV